MLNEVQAVSRVRQAVVAIRSGWAEQEDLDIATLEAKGTIMRLRVELAAAEREIDSLINHRCEWSENDYCVWCGADGRA